MGRAPYQMIITTVFVVISSFHAIGFMTTFYKEYQRVATQLEHDTWTLSQCKKDPRFSQILWATCREAEQNLRTGSFWLAYDNFALKNGMNAWIQSILDWTRIPTGYAILLILLTSFLAFTYASYFTQNDSAMDFHLNRQKLKMV
jgi:hypothetical protein